MSVWLSLFAAYLTRKLVWCLVIAPVVVGILYAAESL